MRWQNRSTGLGGLYLELQKDWQRSRFLFSVGARGGRGRGAKGLMSNDMVGLFLLLFFSFLGTKYVIKKNEVAVTWYVMSYATCVYVNKVGKQVGVCYSFKGNAKDTIYLYHICIPSDVADELAMPHH